MKRKLFGLIFAVILLISLSPAAFASELSLVNDDAGLLTAQEVEALTEKAEAVSQEYDMDVVIVTNESLGGKTPEAYADDYYDEHGYGDDGILFLLSMEYRDWYISTCGSGIYALTDYGIQQVGEAALPSLGQGDYYKGFNAYLDALVPYLEAFRQGAPVDGQANESGDFYHGTREEIVHYEKSRTLGGTLMVTVPISLIVAGIAVLLMRIPMNTKRSSVGARAYLKNNSYHLSQCQDLFLYSNVTKTRRPEPTSSSSGGGSSIHHSSSGRSHGGGGGKF